MTRVELNNNLKPYLSTDQPFTMKIKLLLITTLIFGGLSSVAQDYVMVAPSSRGTADYGGKLAMGPSLLGGGIVGLDITGFPGEKVGLEGSIYYRPSLVATRTFGGSTRVNVYHGAMMTFGPNIYLKKDFSRSGHKMYMNGIFIKGGYGIGTMQEGLAAIGWARERFKAHRNSNSFGIQLGLGFTYLISSSVRIDSYGSLGGNGGSMFAPILFFKMRWNFYLLPFWD